MCTTFIDAVRDRLKDGGYAEVNNNTEHGGQFLVGYAGHLYRVATDFQVGESRDTFDAVGCGASYALGAMEVSRAISDPVKRLKHALRVAEHFSIGVRRPIIVKHQQGKTNDQT